MGYFLRKIAFLFLMFFSLLAVALFLLWYNFSKISPSKEGFIFLGDSRINNAFNDINNYGLSSESPVFTFYKLKEIHRSTKLNKVFLAFNEHSIAKYYDGYTVNAQIVERYLEYLPSTYFYSNFYKMNYPRMIVDRLKNLNVKKTTILGGYEVPPTNKFFNINDCNNELNIQYEDGLFSENNIQYFDSIKNYCSLNNIDLVIIKTPIHKYYKSNIPEKFVEKYNSLTRGDSILNFEDSLGLDKFFLPDGTHLSPEGSKLFTEMLEAKLKEFQN
jgi:hypothetical protein